MTIRSVLRLAAADQDAWREVSSTRRPRALFHLLAWSVAPVSLLPPLMLYYAGSLHGDQFVPGFGAKSWLAIALAFLAAEWITLAVMGPVIRAIARANGGRCTVHDARVLAMVSPIPLWFSSLILLVPSLAMAISVALLALALSIIVTFQGVRRLCRPKDDVVAAAITQGVVGVELIGWALLLVLLIPR